MKKKILLFKNDRGGDLLNSIQCISSLLNNLNDVTIFLSNYNISFSFLFKNAKVRKINYDLGLRIQQIEETVLDVTHRRAKLPDNFYSFNYVPS